MSNKPKIIHYCWFGNKDFPKKEQYCIDGWKKILPDYEFILWNEKNFDVSKSKYAAQAYQKGAYAYVSDYVRTVVLEEYGGTYLDTDMEVFSGFREVIEQNDNVMGFLTKRQIGAGVISLVDHHPIMSQFIKFYDRDFIVNGQMNVCDNTSVLTSFLQERGLVMNSQTQLVEDILIVKREIFYPKKISENEFNVTPETVAIHHASGSWMSERQRKRGNNKIWIKVARPVLSFCRKTIYSILGEKKARDIEIWIRAKLR